MQISFRRFLLWMIMGGHALFLFSLLFAPPLSPKRDRRMSVQLRQPKSELAKPIAVSTPSSPPKSKTAAIPKNKPVNKQPSPPLAPPQPQKILPKQNKKPNTSKPIAKNPATKVKKPSSPSIKKPIVSEDLIKELEQSIAKIEEKRDSTKSKSVALTNRKEPTVFIPLSSFDPAPSLDLSSSEEFKELLVQELRSMLHLPEYGEVKMRLTFRSDGSVSEVKVLKTASRKNEDYLQKELPKHRFPFLADPDLKEMDRSFVITFCNDI